LLLYSHGTIVGRPGRLILGPPALASDDGMQAWLLRKGYALAAASYAKPIGWAVEDAMRDQISVLERFGQAVGKPRRVIAWGDSQGGLDTALLLERYPGRFVGGFSVCGLLGGGVSYFNHDFDMFFALDVLLAPGQLIHAGAPTIAGIDSGPAEGVIDSAQASPAGEARLALTAALQDFPHRFSPTDSLPATGDWKADEAGQVDWIRFQLGTAFREDVERRAMGNPSWNTGVDYSSLLQASPDANEVAALYRSAGIDLAADLARLRNAPRISADAAAVQYMTEFGEPNGRLSLPLLTMHTTDDGRVIPGNERSYADLVSLHGQPNVLRQLFVSRGGHCAFSDAEMIAGFETLLRRIDSGKWPDTSPTAMNRLAAGAGSSYARSAPLEYQITNSGQFVSFEPVPLPR
jgi:pimeloyl-ACP methyl ester carboxylesterase